MDRSKPIDPGKGNQETRLHQLAEIFQEAWKNATSVEITRFLPPAGDPFRTVALRELIKTDLNIRWQRKQRVSLESYLKTFPELGSPGALPVELIYEEYRIRQLHGDHPELSVYRQRFPAQYPELESMVREAQTQAGVLPAAAKVVAAPLPQRAAAPKPASPAAPREEVTVAYSPAPQPAVQMVNGYKLSKRLGSGSFAEVWEGEAPGGFPVAIKRIIKPLDDDLAQRELQSLESISKLRHMFLLQTHRTFIDDNHLYVVMELADGTLRDRMKLCQKQGWPGIPLPELINYFRESAEALDYMHSKNLIHRDIKPHNILLLNGHAKVADFGLATLHDTERMMFTATGSGTPAYMAPEVWQRKVSPRSDQYSLAATWAEQRLGRWAFQGRDLPSLMMEHLQGTPDLTGLPAAEQAVLRKGLAKDPDKRYASCLEFVHALEDALTEELRKSNPSIRLRVPAAGEPPQGSTKLDTDRHTRRQLSGQSATVAGVLPLAPPAKKRPFVAFLLGILLVLSGGGLVWLMFLRDQIGSGSGAPFSLAPLPLTIHRGESGKLQIGVTRTSFSGAINLELRNLPPGLVVDIQPIEPEQTSIELAVRANPQGELVENHQVMLRAVGGGHQQDIPVSLTVHPLWYPLPDRWQPAKGAELVEHEGKVLWTRIEVDRDGLPVPFVLIRRARRDDPATFYIMEDKVSVALFRKFTDGGAKLTDPDWQWNKLTSNQVPDNPVLGVSVADAHLFARWLDGYLPTIKQWDKAAGRFEPGAAKGPFLEPYGPDEIGINRKEPLKLPLAVKDISPLKVRNMAGNGLEWTAQVVSPVGLVEEKRPLSYDNLPFNSQVVVRGQSFNSLLPFHYKDLEKNRQLVVDQFHAQVGFRVVLELE